MYLIILAAGQGTRLKPLTDNKPKCLVEVSSKSILQWQLWSARMAGIEKIAVVRGYRKEMISPAGVTVVDNPDFATTNMVETLWMAEQFFQEGFIVAYGDIIYEPKVLKKLMQAPSGIQVVVDHGWKDYWSRRFSNVLDDAETLRLDEEGQIQEIGQKPNSIEEIEGQYIGLMKFSGDGVEQLKKIYAQAHREEKEGKKPLGKDKSARNLYFTDILQGIIESGYPVHQVPINRHWLEIDSPEDLLVAEKFLQKQDSGFSIIG